MANNKRKIGNALNTAKKLKIEKEKTTQSENTWTHWLMKSEPESRFENGIDLKFGLEDLKKEPEQTACWDGVRNYQARNFMMQMKSEQQAFFYHSNCKPPGKNHVYNSYSYRIAAVL